MYRGGNYPQETAVAVVQTQRFGVMERHTPAYFRQGVQIGCMVLTFPMVVIFGIFGILLIFMGAISVGIFSTLRSHFDNGINNGAHMVDIILLTVGIIIVLASIAVCFYARMKYMNYLQQIIDNPGGVINTNPHQPTSYRGQNASCPNQQASYPVQHTSYPVQQASYPVQQASYPVQQASYPVQQASYPGQQASYPGQQAFYPGQPAAFPGQQATFPGEPCQPPQPGKMATNYRMIQPGELVLTTASTSNPAMDYHPGTMHMPLNEEYRPPPAYAPDSSPPPYTP